MLELNEAKELLERLVRESKPGKRNATNGLGCVYLNDKGERCVVGEAMHVLGLEPLHPNDPPLLLAYSDPTLRNHPHLIDRHMSPAAYDFLGRCQLEFDQGGNGDEPPTWRQALAICKKKDWWPK